MTFGELAIYFSKLERESSRLNINQVLAEVFGLLSGEETKCAIRLMMGNLGPKFEKFEIGMAERMLSRTIAFVLQTSEDEVWGRYKKLGDMGSAYEDLAGENLGEVVGIVDVYEYLIKLSQVSGEGSQDTKISMLSELLKRVSRVEGKFLIRFIIGDLRLGIGEMSIIDGLSVMLAGDKSMHEVIESAYNVYADIGELARKIVELRISNNWRDDVIGYLENVKIELGVPVVSALCVRVDTYDEIVEKLGKVICEPKYDGTRVQIHFRRNGSELMVKTFTRNLDESSHMFPELINVAEDLFVDEVILDCEAMGWDQSEQVFMNFQKTITRKRKHGIENALKDVPLRFMVFDVLYVRGAVCDLGDIHNWGLSKRRDLLGKIINIKSNLLIIDPAYVCESSERIKELHEYYLNQGLEGVVVKMFDSPYVPGRKKGFWIKIKDLEDSEGQLSDTIDCVIMGYYRGRGRRSDLKVGSLLLGIKGAPCLIGGMFDQEEGWVTLCKLGTKMSDEVLVDLGNVLDNIKSTYQPNNYYVSKNLVPDVWVDPKIIVEIAGDAVTESSCHTAGVSVRFPRLIKQRTDKSLQEVNTINEVRSLMK